MFNDEKLREVLISLAWRNKGSDKQKFSLKVGSHLPQCKVVVPLGCKCSLTTHTCGSSSLWPSWVTTLCLLRHEVFVVSGSPGSASQPLLLLIDVDKGHIEALSLTVAHITDGGVTTQATSI